MSSSRVASSSRAARARRSLERGAEVFFPCCVLPRRLTVAVTAARGDAERRRAAAVGWTDIPTPGFFSALDWSGTGGSFTLFVFISPTYSDGASVLVHRESACVCDESFRFDGGELYHI